MENIQRVFDKLTNEDLLELHLYGPALNIAVAQAILGRMSIREVEILIDRKLDADSKLSEEGSLEKIGEMIDKFTNKTPTLASEVPMASAEDVSRILAEPPRKRHMSETGRKAVAKAQKKRWATWHKNNNRR